MCIQGEEKGIILTDGRKKSCDPCIHELVQFFNDSGLQTLASCCGHDKRPVNIVLKGGKEIMIIDNYEEARMVDKLFIPLNKCNHWRRFAIKRFLARKLLK